MRHIVAVCPKCGVYTKLQKHHIAPRFLFGRQHNHEVILLCEKCHKKLDRIVCVKRKLKKSDYLRITLKWLSGGCPVIVGEPIYGGGKKWQEEQTSMTGW